MNCLYSILSLCLFLSCAVALKCKCNNAFKALNDNVQKSGLLLAISNCGDAMECEIDENTCKSSKTCTGIWNFLARSKHYMQPSCLYEVGGNQGCHWFGSNLTERCDKTRGPIRPSQHNYRCRTGDFCNDVTREWVNAKCAPPPSRRYLF